MFDAATGVFESKVNIEKIIRAFCLLQEETRRVHLSILSNRIYEVIGNKRNIELGEIILNFADNLNNEMQKKEISDSRFELEIILYRLTLAAHKGKNSEMERLFNEGAKLIPKLIQYTENYNLIFMFINRYAVFLIDEFEIEKAYNLLEKTIN